MLFDTTDFPERWKCGTWSEAHGWLHIVSDFTIFACYMAIPILLLYFTFHKKNRCVSTDLLAVRGVHPVLRLRSPD